MSVPPRQDQRLQLPGTVAPPSATVGGHSPLLRQICADAIGAAGHLPFTSSWHDRVPAVMLVDERQQAFPPVQSAASLQVTAVPEQAVAFGWHTFGFPMTSQQTSVASAHDGPASLGSQLTKPGVHVAPPVGGLQPPSASPMAGSNAGPDEVETLELLEPDATLLVVLELLVVLVPLLPVLLVVLLALDELVVVLLFVPVGLLLEQCIISRPATNAAGEPQRIQFRVI